jgi:hypothetical protein
MTPRSLVCVPLAIALLACGEQAEVAGGAVDAATDAHDTNDTVADAAAAADVLLDAQPDGILDASDQETVDAVADVVSSDTVADVLLDVAPDAGEDVEADVDVGPGAPPSPCLAHERSCDGVCRMVEVDRAACGACDVACVDGDVCEQGACVTPAPRAPDCDEAKVAEALAAATPTDAYVSLDCSLTLPVGSTLTKAIRITGREASGVVLDCQGSTLTRGVEEGGADLVVVESRRVGDGWERPTDVTIRDCRIEGAVRIRGQGNNGQAADVTTDSWTVGHRERAQLAAPTRVLLERLTIVGESRIPLYLAPGVTEVTFRDSEVLGESVSTLVYLDAESAYNRIVGNRFAAVPTGLVPREEIAIDGSASNLVSGNTFDGVAAGAIFIYRNCGEGGAVRHQEPRRNIISGNVFVLEGRRQQNPWLWVGSRNEGGIHRAVYCDLDDAYDFGSGASDLDFARDTVVVDNRYVDSPVRPTLAPLWGLIVDDVPTYIDANSEIDAPESPVGAVCVVFGDASPPVVLRESDAAPDGRVCTDGTLTPPGP